MTETLSTPYGDFLYEFLDGCTIKIYNKSPQPIELDNFKYFCTITLKLIYQSGWKIIDDSHFSIQAFSSPSKRCDISQEHRRIIQNNLSCTLAYVCQNNFHPRDVRIAELQYIKNQLRILREKIEKSEGRSCLLRCEKMHWEQYKMAIQSLRSGNIKNYCDIFMSHRKNIQSAVDNAANDGYNGFMNYDGKLEKMVNDLAIKIFPDYPNIDKCNVYEQLMAIASSYEGVSLANEDCHLVIKALMHKLGMITEDLLDLWEDLKVTGSAVQEETE